MPARSINNLDVNFSATHNGTNAAAVAAAALVGADAARSAQAMRSHPMTAPIGMGTETITRTSITISRASSWNTSARVNARSTGSSRVSHARQALPGKKMPPSPSASSHQVHPSLPLSQVAATRERQSPAAPLPRQPAPGETIKTTQCNQQAALNGTNLSSLVALASAQGGSLRPRRRANGEAVIIEVRRLVRLPTTLLHFRELLPSHWRITLLHGPRNAADIWATNSRTLREHLRQQRVRLMPLPTQQMLVDAKATRTLRDQGGALPNRAAFDLLLSRTLKSILSAEELKQVRSRYDKSFEVAHDRGRRWYNSFLQSTTFWELFSSENVLLFEADAVLCPRPTLPLDWWAGRFAYVGSPWFPRTGAGYFFCKYLTCCVGNSGFSLWHRPLIAGLLANGIIQAKPTRLVDIWIAR